MTERARQLQALANSAADAFLLGNNFYDLAIEAASEAFVDAQRASHQPNELKLTDGDRRAFVQAFLKGIIVAVERECEQLPAALPLGD